MTYPTRFYFLYPCAGAVGIAAVVGLREFTMAGEPLWWIITLALSAFGLWVGWMAAIFGADDHERGERAPIGKAAWGATLAIPIVLYLRDRIDPEVGLWLFGLLLLALCAGFAAGLLSRSLMRREAAKDGHRR